jgi:DNA-3-methyladenine glycosylase
LKLSSRSKILTSNFFLRETNVVAQDLLGKKLVRILTIKNKKRIKISGTIVETEAYGFKNDQASHAFKGMTKSNHIMFGHVGRSYVYFIYGNHFCFNVTARSSKELAGAVLLRALEPQEGINYMKEYRDVKDINTLTNGPGKIAQALCIGKQHNNYNLTNINSELYIEEEEEEKINSHLILSTKRIGITKSIDEYWRYVLATKKENVIYLNKFVSKRKENNYFRIVKYYNGDV